MIREDFVTREIRRLAEALARIATMRQRGEQSEALRAIEAACSGLGIGGTLREVLTPEALAGILRTRDKLAFAAQLADEEALVLEAMGRSGAERCRARATALRELSERAGP